MAPTLAARAPAFADSHSGSPLRWRTSMGLLALVLWAGWMSKVDPRLFLSRQTWAAVADLVTRLFPPDLSLDFLKVALHATLTTAATAIVATSISVLLAMPLGFLASGRLWRTGSGSPLMRAASWVALHGMGAVRSVPDLVWALLFVAGLGLGPLAGTLALAVSYSALLGRVYADIFDEADARPLEALTGLGATRLQVFLFGILPQRPALLTSYTLYSFECSVRSAAVLGFVGAGGLGYEISLSLRLFDFSQVLTLIVCFVLLLLLVDLLSRFIRTRLGVRDDIAGPTAKPLGRRVRRLAIAASVATIPLFALPVSGVTWSNLSESDTIPNLLHFAGARLRPSYSPAFLDHVGLLALQTIAISVVGTAAGALLGMLLAFPATRLRSARHESLDRSWPVRVRSESTFWLSRLSSNLLRATPELVWASLCVIVLGFGPFAGCLALGLHTGGVLGKLFAEAMEESPQQPVEAMLAFGATPMQCMIWSILPQSWPILRRYILLRWDMNLRAATILGLVGAGGLGQALYNNVQLGDYSKVSTLIAAVIVLVIASDWLSQSTAATEMQT